jgi:hypothetical protein
MTEPGLGINQSLPVAAAPEEPSLFVSPTMLEIPRPPTPPAHDTGRQLRSGTCVGQVSPASSPTRSRRLVRPKAALPRKTRGFVESKRRQLEDIYGFGAIGEDEDGE